MPKQPPANSALHELATLRGHHSEIHTLRLSPEGDRALAMSSDSGRASLWDVWALHRVASLDVEPHLDAHASFSSDGEVCAVSGKDGVVRLWTRDGHPAAILPLSQIAPATGLDFAPTDEVLVAADGAGSISLWRWADETQMLRVEVLRPEERNPATRERGLHPRYRPHILVYGLALSPDGSQLAVHANTRRGLVQRWAIDLNGPSMRHQTTIIPADRGDFVRDLRYSPDGRYLAVLISGWHSQLKGPPPPIEERVEVYDSVTWECLNIIRPPREGWRERINTLLLPLEGWSANIKGWRASIKGCAFSPDGRYLALGGEESLSLEGEEVRQHETCGRIWLWDMAAQRFAATEMAHPDPGYAQVWALASLDWAKRAPLLATGGYDPGPTATGGDDFVVKIWAVNVGPES